MNELDGPVILPEASIKDCCVIFEETAFSSQLSQMGKWRDEGFSQEGSADLGKEGRMMHDSSSGSWKNILAENTA